MTTSPKVLLEELKTAPEPLLREVLDFVRFLKSRAASDDVGETALASQAVLSKDWLRSEEEEAWKNL
jgi:hypothetical protein